MIPAIVLTGFGNLDKALSVIRDLDAYWFLEKPLKLIALQSLLERAIQHSQLLRKAETLERDLILQGALGRLGIACCARLSDPPKRSRTAKLCFEANEPSSSSPPNSDSDESSHPVSLIAATGPGENIASH